MITFMTLRTPKFYSQLNEKQDKLFSEYPADKKIVIDSVDKLVLLNELLHNLSTTSYDEIVEEKSPPYAAFFEEDR